MSEWWQHYTRLVRAVSKVAGKDNVAVRRIYAPTKPLEGFRVLVDRIWPRATKSTITPWGLQLYLDV